MYPEDPYGLDSEYRSEPEEYSRPSCYNAVTPRRRRKRRRGWWGLAALLLLAVGSVWLFSRYSFELRHTDNGMTLVVRDPDSAGMKSLPSVEAEQPQPLRPKAAGAGPRLALGDTPAAPAGFSGEGLSLQEIYRKVLPSVVSITTTLRNGSSSGTGIIMSADGYIITNAHVVDEAVGIEILTWDDQSYAAGLVGSDSTSDLAVLKVESDTLTAADFGNSEQIAVGDAVVAIGDPLGRKLRGTMTDGIISAINRDLTVNGRALTLIQTNAALNNGNSGGPLINAYGQVIGINTVKVSSYYTSATVEGLGFAIPISVAKPVIDELIEYGYVSGRPALGITGTALPDVYRAYYRLPDGVYVETVDPDSDAYAKGLREGDTITAVAGTSVRTVDELNVIKNQYQAGDELELTVFRDGESFTLNVILGEAAGS